MIACLYVKIVMLVILLREFSGSIDLFEFLLKWNIYFFYGLVLNIGQWTQKKH